MLCVCVLSLSLFGCSKPENNVELKKNVSCQLLDVLTITNDTDNSTYYYYLASVENKGKKPYDTKNLIYTVTDDNEKILVSLINISLRLLISSIRDKIRIFMDILDFQTMTKKLGSFF